MKKFSGMIFSSFGTYYHLYVIKLFTENYNIKIEIVRLLVVLIEMLYKNSTLIIAPSVSLIFSC